MTRFFILMGFSSNDMTPYIYAGLTDNTQWKFKNNIKKVEPSDIIKAVSKVSGIDVNSILSARREQDICEARCIAIALILRANPTLRLKQVGSIFNRDHSTVIYNRNLFEDLTITDKNFAKKVTKVKQLI